MNVFAQVIRFLLGVETDPGIDFNPKTHRRRWSSVQAKEFGELHSLVSYLILSCEKPDTSTGRSKGIVIRGLKNICVYCFLLRLNLILKSKLNNM